MRGECKTPGGKLVAVNVAVDQQGRIDEVHVDGDFFVDSPSDAAAEGLLHDVERALAAGERVQPVIDAHTDARLIGADAYALETAFARACAAGTGAKPADRPATGWNNMADTALAQAATQEYRRRWDQLKSRLTVIHDAPRMPAEQMSVDERWAREVAAGDRPPTLRIWEWAGPAVVIGRFQSAPDEVNLDTAKSEGFDVVRRCTGGGAMFIEPGNTITYSLYAPLDFVHGVSIEESYRLCDWWLVDALRGLGLDVRFAGLNDLASQYGKIGGAAQRRFPAVPSDRRQGEHTPGAVLHHVTLAYDIDAEKMGRVLNTSREKLSDKAVRSAVKRVDPLRSQTGMSRGRIVERLLASLAGHGA